ncbi:MAG TPA: hypothetical protein VI818_02945 [Candidatus Thermoplasmatota archaeon]|nr:hypothetical protein [Candidatus Thermoplasmatota archaeon]
MFRRGVLVGAVMMLGGTLLLAFKQVTRVFDDPARLELGDVEAGPTDPTFVLLSAIIIASGFATVLGTVSPATGWRRPVALGALGVSVTLLLGLHLPLFVNGTVVSSEADLFATFTASHLFHTGNLYSLMAVFLLFLLTVSLLGVVVFSVGYLLAPGRFGKAVADPRSWPKNEANLVASTLLLLFATGVFLTYLVRTAAKMEAEPPQFVGFFGGALLLFYYLQILCVLLFVATVLARVFLVNWGTQLPWEPLRVRESLQNVGRVERILVLGAVAFNMLVLMAPPATDNEGLSVDPVFRLDSRGLAWFFFLLAVPYTPYALSLRRMRNLLTPPSPFGIGSPPFSAATLQVIGLAAGGFLLIGTVAGAADWSPLALLMALGAWLAGVLLWASVRVSLQGGMLSPHLNGDSGPAYFGWFIVFALVTAIMMWGAGNNIVGTYEESSRTLTVENSSPWGADLLFRVGGVSLLSATLLLSFAVAKASLGVRRSLVGSYAASFVGMVLLGVMVFSISMWSTNEQVSDAYVGFAFHQFYLTEKIFVAALIVGLGSMLVFTFGRMVGAVLRRRPAATLVESIQIG